MFIISEELRQQTFLNFYNRYNRDHKLMSDTCPFWTMDYSIRSRFGKIPCNQLCCSLDELEHKELLENSCPCDIYGSEVAVGRLEAYLRRTGKLDINTKLTIKGETS